MESDGTERRAERDSKVNDCSKLRVQVKMLKYVRVSVKVVSGGQEEGQSLAE